MPVVTMSGLNVMPFTPPPARPAAHLSSVAELLVPDLPGHAQPAASAACHAIGMMDEIRARQPSLEAHLASSLPHALSSLAEIRALLAGKRPIVFLDYDGTLAPIVSQPEKALMSEQMRDAVRVLSASKSVAIVSGRGRQKVQDFVQLSGLVYAGSHGHDIALPGGARHRVGAEALPQLAAARDSLRAQLADIPGASVEDNLYSVSVHWRNTPPEFRSAVANATQVEVERRGLALSHGKCVHEIRPAGGPVWNKGEAVRYLLDRWLGDDAADEREAVPIYIGDDTTDEDAFAVLRGLGGLSFLVAGAGETERPRQTFGTHRLADCAEVEALLRHLAAV